MLSVVAKIHPLRTSARHAVARIALSPQALTLRPATCAAGMVDACAMMMHADSNAVSLFQGSRVLVFGRQVAAWRRLQSETLRRS